MLSYRRYCRNLLILAGVIPLACAIGLFFDWQQDNAVLRRQAMAVTAGRDNDSARIRAVNDWVYHNKGFEPNNQYFIIPALGPTPVQVMEQGGYCADKSRLVAALLNRLGIDAGLVMISLCRDCGFIHTVVEARYEGGRMVVDPTWDVDYPTDDGKFLGVTDLAGTNRGQERVAELRQQRPATDKIGHMPPADATFDYAVAINWDRNFITRSVAAMLRLTGYEPEVLFRPRLLEDPKLFLILCLLGIATSIVLGGVLLDRGGGAVKKRSTMSAPHTI
jgi:Transglutaminase-like superfamily